MNRFPPDRIDFVLLPEARPFVLRVPPEVGLDGEAFFQLCHANELLHLERTPAGDVLVWPLVSPLTSLKNGHLSAELTRWSKQDGTGHAFGPSAGFALPTGSILGPDAAWVRRDRAKALSEEEWEHFWPLCPDFVAEICARADNRPAFRAKMAEYVEAGAQLAWLLDLPSRQVSIYRPGQDVQTLKAPASLSGDPVLPGFTLALEPIWNDPY